MATKVGAWSETMPATKDIQKICDQVMDQVEKKPDKNNLEYNAVEYRYQVVEGRNYVIKVHLGETDYNQLSLFQALDGKLVRLDMRPIAKDGPLVPFP